MMERLTQYFECGAYVDKSNIVDISQVAGQFFEKGAYMGKAIDKLAEFEDFLEEHDCETLADYTKQVRKEVCEEIKEKSELFGVCKTGILKKEYRIDKDVLDQIQGVEDGKINN